MVRRPSPATVIALVALLVALGGVGVAATGGNFILGQSNSAGKTTALSSGVTTGPTVQLTNGGGKPAARFTTNSGVPPFLVDRSTRVPNLNADWLDGRDSAYFLPKTAKATDAARLDGNTPGAFYHRQRSVIQQTSSCVTAAQTWQECADVDVTIPAGHLWYVTVISAVTANPGNAYVEALLCPASTGPSCVSGISDRVTFEPNQYTNWSSSYTSSYYAGTYRFNTAMKWPFVLPANSEAFTTTTVIVYDYRQEYLADP